SGRVTTRFKPAGGPIHSIELDLSHLLTVDSVEFHGTVIPFQHTQSDILIINFPQALPDLMADSVTVAYHGVPGFTGFGSFEIDAHASGPIVWTLSEPYGSKEWWPCHQDLNDKIDTVDVLVTTPSVYRVAGNGILISEQITGNSKLTHWHSEYPTAAYLIGVAATNYAVFTDTVLLSDGTALPVVEYVYPEDSSRIRTRLIENRFLDVLLFFDSLLGKYPFSNEKYGHAQFGWGGGMEHQTMSFVGSFDPSLLAHELAHQWFGDKITCGSWQDIWLNEGFATYLQGLGRQRIAPEMWPSFLAGLSNTITSQPGGSVFCSDTSEVGRVFDYRLSYCKGAYLLHMLRWVLGDADFFSSVRNYLADPDLIYSYARTSNFKSHLENVSGKNLSSFFDQWFTGSGFPSYQLEWNQNSNGIELIIGQTQSDTSVSFFSMPVPVQFSGNGRDTILVFDHHYSGQVFRFALDFEVNNVFFDPERRILSAGNSVLSTLEKNSAAVSINIFPNPASSEISLIAAEPSLSIRRVKILDSCGKLVKEFLLNVPLRYLHFPVAEFSDGIYQLEITTGHGISYGKFIKSEY
ncbi:MAG TPA: M1 family aminopeptidase, partial [Bacteroidia bacterium]|nr:M1 family aminopeptidase [Bacteroidia bacterium]